MKIFISDKAKSDLLQFYGYLAERNPLAARAAIEVINTKFANIAQFPFLGRERSTLGVAYAASSRALRSFSIHSGASAL